MWLVRKYPPICSMLLPYGVGGPPAQIWVFGIWLTRRVAVRVKAGQAVKPIRGIALGG